VHDPTKDTTDDALVGDWRILQPRKGHRWSTDDLLCAWFALDTLDQLGMVPDRSLDLGCGLGSVAMMLAWALPGLHVTGLEKQPSRITLARRSVSRNGATDRIRLVEGDVRDARAFLMPPGRAGWPLVTATPPYWPVTSGTHGDDEQARCRFDLIGSVEDYGRAAQDLLAPQGLLVMVYDGRQKERLDRATSGLWRLRARPVVAREGDPPLLTLGVWTLAQADTSPRDPEPPLLLRHTDGTRSPAFSALRHRMGMPA